jgi:hypothetical protein
MKQQYQTDFHFADRESKAEYVWRKYESLLKGRILDVGADECHLRSYLDQGSEYLGVGLGGNLDQVVDLDKEGIPFGDMEYDCVLCLDVLEHLENIHHVFDELCRVTRRYVIISLPNCWASFYNVMRLEDELQGVPLKYYGLPVEKPSDRHKWFFSTEEAEKFIGFRAAKNDMSVVQMDNYGDSSVREPQLVKRIARRLLFRGDFDQRNLFAGPLWAVLEKGRTADQ